MRSRETKSVENAQRTPGRQRVAVVGSGISGLSAAWLLARKYDVSLFEQENRFGGHTHTVSVDCEGAEVGVDTGFIVFNRRNYPQLSALFNHLGVATQSTDMSFAVSISEETKAGYSPRIEYAGDTLSTLYGQRSHLLTPRFHRMVWDILRFNRVGRQFLGRSPDPSITVGQFLERERYGSAFRDHYLLPMAAAIWSCPTQAMLEFPASSLLTFFENHGLLSLTGRPQWRTVVGGSRRYVDTMLVALGDNAKAGARVRSVRRDENRPRLLLDDGTESSFDHIVIAAHADQALAMLTKPSVLEKHLLGAFRYQTNRALLHTDANLMPLRSRLWASWNYLSEGRSLHDRGVSVTYWMNRLQRLPQGTNLFVSLNPLREPSAARVVREMAYEHPVFDKTAMAAQRQLHRIQGQGGLWFCGSYFGYGFHEDGLTSAIGVAQALGILTPWLTDEHKGVTATGEIR